MKFKTSVVVASICFWSAFLLSGCGNDDSKQTDAAKRAAVGQSVIAKTGIDIDFSKNPFPPEIVDANGFSVPEPWGRWTDGDRAVLTFNNSLPKTFDLVLIVHAVFAPNANKPLKLKIGDIEETFTVSTPDQTITIPVRLGVDARSIEIKLPAATSPKSVGASEDTRRLGIGISRIKISPKQ